MQIIQTDIEGVLIIEPKVFGDSRGYFFESFNAKEFREKTGWKIRSKLTPEFRSKLTPSFSFNSRQESRNFRAEPSRFVA